MSDTLDSAPFDYIIAGSGCAGLSLLYRILMEPSLQAKSILVIDREKKEIDDRTWCFWEKNDGLFQRIVEREWQMIGFKTDNYNRILDIFPYKYKMIRGLRFYSYVISLAGKSEKVSFLYDHIESISNSGGMVEVKTSNGIYKAGYVFNSTRLFYPAIKTGIDSLMMHFRGLTIKTQNKTFDVNKPMLMDFNVNQQSATAFVYLLPLNEREALVEYTLINEKALKPEQYNSALQHYINQELQIEDFEIVHEESGVIPMFKKQFPTRHGKIIHIGTAAGCVKSSSGYAFQFIQTHTGSIVNKLKNNKVPVVKCTFSDRKFRVYDKTFIQVLLSQKLSGKQLMEMIFSNNGPATVMSFLNNETQLVDDLKLMTSLPVKVFLPTAIKEILPYYKP